MKKRILCFGDSLTFGYDPKYRIRMDEDNRYTCVLEKELGEDFRVIEEGQNGRTIASDDPNEGEKNGIKYIVPCIESQWPLDYITIMLGSNDLKKKFNYSSMDIAGEMRLFLQKVIALNHFDYNDHIKIILIAPPYVGENIRDSWLGDCFGYEKAVETSKELADWYRILAEEYSIEFMDAAEICKVSDWDSVHLDGEEQIKLGKALAEKIKEMEIDSEKDKIFKTKK